MTTPTANTQPIWAAKPDVSVDGATGMESAITAAANDYTGISANYSLVFTAGADGGYIEAIKFTPVGTNVQTVARIFANNGSEQTTATNNVFLGEITLPATTASSNAALISPVWVPANGIKRLNAGFRIYVGLATAVAAGWVPVVEGGGQY